MAGDCKKRLKCVYLSLILCSLQTYSAVNGKFNATLSRVEHKFQLFSAFHRSRPRVSDMFQLHNVPASGNLFVELVGRN